MSIKNKLIILMLVLSIVPLSTVGIIAMRKSQTTLENQIGIGSLEHTRMARDRINVYLYSKFIEIRNLNKEEVIYSFFTDKFEKHISKFLPFLNKSFDDYFYIAYLGKNGNVIYGSTDLVKEMNFSNSIGFKKAVTGTEHIENAGYIDEVKGISLIFFIPVFDIISPQNVMGVVTAALKWDRVVDMLNAIEVQLGGQNELNHIDLLEKNGLVIGSIDKGEIFHVNLVEKGLKSALLASRGEEGYLVEVLGNGNKTFSSYTQLTAYKDMPNLNWLLIFSQDIKEIFKSVDSLRRITIILIAGTIFLLFLISFLIAHKITNPLITIAKAAEEIGQGNLQKRVEVNTEDEIGDLARAFNKMSNDIKVFRDELLLSKEYTENIISSMAEILIVLDRDGRIKKINQAGCSLLDYEEVELKGKPFNKIINDVNNEFESVKRKLEKTSLVRNSETVFISKKGKQVPIILSASQMNSNDDRRAGIVIIALDISERKKVYEELFESEKKFRAIFEKSVVGFSLFGEDGKLFETNVAFQKMLGYSHNELLEKSFLDITHPEDIDKNSHYFHELLSGKRDNYSFEKRYITKTGKTVWGSLSVFSLRDEKGDILFRIAMVQDITDRKRAEEEEESNRNLEIKASLLEEQNWLKSGLNQLSNVMCGYQDIQTLPDKIITFLSLYLKAGAGSIYVLNQDIGSFILASSNGYGAGDMLPPIISRDEAFTGKVISESKYYFLTDISENANRLKSYFGDSLPTNLLGFPALFEGKILAIIELASVEVYGDKVKEFVMQAQSVIGTALNRIFMGMEVEKLLKQYQGLSEKLTQQSKELQLTNEQLESQPKDLLTIQNDLTVRNSELEETKIKLQDRAELLEETSRYKSEFLANMSHELRTPLNSIMILSKILTMEKIGTLTTIQKKHANTIYDSGVELLDQINNILDISKIESGKIEAHYNNFNIRPAIRKLIEIFQIRAEEKRLNFEIIIDTDVPDELLGDEDRIKQILNNLLSNAIKFTLKGSIVFSVKLVKKNSIDAIAFSVTDTGIGIAEDKQKLIFEPFVQADESIGRDFGGTGLGLSISDNLAALLGGTIELESKPGEGSTFTLTLPIIPDSALQNNLRSRINEAKHQPVENPIELFKLNEMFLGKTILIADNDFRNTYALASALEMKGFSVISVSNGIQALDELKKDNKIDLVLMDIMMPVMDGYTAIKEIRKIDKYKDLPVIALTAKTMKGDRAKSILAGASDYLSKPVNWDNLFLLLPAWL